MSSDVIEALALYAIPLAQAIDLTTVNLSLMFLPQLSSLSKRTTQRNRNYGTLALTPSPQIVCIIVYNGVCTTKSLSTPFVPLSCLTVTMRTAFKADSTDSTDSTVTLRQLYSYGIEKDDSTSLLYGPDDVDLCPLSYSQLPANSCVMLLDVFKCRNVCLGVILITHFIKMNRLTHFFFLV